MILTEREIIDLINRHSKSSTVTMINNAPVYWGSISGVLSNQTDLHNALNSKIDKSIGTTKGDLIVFTSSATPTRFGSGTNNHCLASDSAQSSGLKWLDVKTLFTANNPLSYNSSTGQFALEYNPTNLRLTSSALNTIQDIATSSRPTFAGLDVTDSIVLSGSNRWIGTTDNVGFALRTNNIDRVFIDNAGNVGIWTTNPTAQLTQKSTTALESAPLGPELLSSSGWTTTGWTGNWSSGFTHTTGNTTALTNTLAAVNGNLYQITYTVTGRTAGSFTITFGGVTSLAFSATGTWGPKAISTGSLSITPTADFNGTITISIKQITGTYSPTYVIVNSAGGNAIEIRSTSNELNNTFIGIEAGRYNTTGGHNTAQGAYALYSNTTGFNNSVQGVYALHSNTTGFENTAQGVYALFSNTTGFNNSAQGYVALFSNTTGFSNSAQGKYALFSNTTGFENTAQGVYALFSNTTGFNNTAQGVYALFSNTTGFNNSAQGYVALFSNTTGFNNTAQGVYAGCYISGGSSPNQTSNNSVYLGFNTMALADGDTNEIVIGANATGAGSNSVVLGNDSITKTILKGNVGINIINPLFKLDVNGTGRFTGDLTLSAILNQQGTSGTNIFKADINQQGNKSIYNNFTSGWTGSGWRLDYGITSQNQSHLELDNLTVRGTMRVYELIINQIRATNGSLFVSSSAKIESIATPEGPNIIVTVEDPEGHNVAPFLVNDIVIVQRVRLDSITVVKRLVRRVVGVNGRNVELAVLSDGPNDVGSFAKGDTLVRIGNTTNTQRQGSVYLTSDDSNAPYIDVTNDVNNWTAWAGSNKLKLRLGRLSGITDALLGSLSGYGLYAKGGIYLSSNSPVAGILMTVDNASARFEMRQGSNKIFEFNTATSTAKIAGAVFTNSAIYKLTSGTPSSNPVGGFVLDSLNNAFTIYKNMDDYVRMYYISGTNWGLKGISSASEVFSLGSSNKISGWTFDDFKLYNDIVSLEASASMKGLVVDSDKVKVGKFNGSGISNSYSNITSIILNGYNGIAPDDTAWGIVGNFWIGSNQHTPSLTITNNYANSYVGTECSSWSYRLTHRMFNHTTHVIGRKIKIGFKVHFTLGQEGLAYSGGRFIFAVRYYNETWSTIYYYNILEQDIPDNLSGTYTIDKTGSNAIEIVLPSNIPDIGSGYVYIEWSWNGGAQSGTYYPYDMDLSDLTFNGYIGYKTWINEKGLQLYNSDLNYIRLFDTSSEINVPILKMRGKPVVRFHGRLSAPPYGDVEVGDMYIKTSDNKTYQCYTIDNNGEPQWTALN